MTSFNRKQDRSGNGLGFSCEKLRTWTCQHTAHFIGLRTVYQEQVEAQAFALSSAPSKIKSSFRV